MEVFGSRVLFAPHVTLAALGFVLAGALFGSVSGLTPGIHVNNVALLLASLAPALPGPTRLVGATILAAGVAHTFLDVVPTLAFGVPDPAMSVSALPGHRLVVGGRGREAIRLSALGSGLAVLLAVPLAIPVTRLMTVAYPIVRAHLPLVLGGVIVFLLATEPGPRAKLGGAVSVLVSGLLGLLVLPLSPNAPLAVGGVLTPLFAGLFGAPVLVDAARGSGIPPQAGGRIAIDRWTVVGTAVAGTVAGAVVGYLPGVSSAIAAVLALTSLPGRTGARGFVVATSGVNTANAIFALFALVSLGDPRTGVLVAFDRIHAPLDLPLLLGAISLAAVVGFVLVLAVGDRYLAAVARFDYARVSAGVFAVLVVVSYLFAGWVGVGVFLVSALVGLLPVRLGVRRVHLMGVLLVPLVTGL